MSEERVFAEVLSGYGCGRVTVSLSAGTVEVERWRGEFRERASGALDASELAALRELAASVRQEEQALVVGDFYAMGEERLRVELDGRRVEIHNDSDRVRTPRASLVLGRCWEIADRLVPWPR
ncbi:MAG: hypothetical protein KC420_16340 [Myxococcales bacterium]|nr:hypothetical protein [Myxococcales bacterium]MCB9568917.1 hypothetical protein [Myxococcales bacterium]MCB9704929.1 hypothetical protein [Myxococcales bacterium]